MPATRKEIESSDRKAAQSSDPWLSVRSAARELGCSPQAVLTAIIAKELEADHRAGRTTVSRVSVEQLKAKRSAA